MKKVTRERKAGPSWNDVKTKLANLDRAGLIGLIQDLYAGSRENRVFLHSRFALGDDVLKPYKAAIARWLSPDVFRNQDISVAKAKKSLSDYRKAIGRPEGAAELTVFYCEQAAGFSNDVGLQDEAYFDALVRMFQQALKVISSLPEKDHQDLLGRLDAVRRISHNFGYGVGDDMDDLLGRLQADGQ